MAVRPSTVAAAVGAEANLRTVVEAVVVVAERSTWVRLRSIALTTVCVHNSTPVNPHLWAGSDQGHSGYAKDAMRPAGFQVTSNGVPTSRPCPK